MKRARLFETDWMRRLWPVRLILRCLWWARGSPQLKVRPIVRGLRLARRLPLAALLLLVYSACAGALAPSTATVQAPTPRAPPTVEPAPAVRAEPFYRRGQSVRPVELIAAIQRQFVLPDGQLALLGTLTSAEREPVQLSTLILTAEDADGGRLQHAELHHGPGRLAPGESAPFMAVASAEANQLRWHADASGTPATTAGPGPLKLTAEPELRTTPQGVPFVLGELQNEGAEPQRALLLLSLWEGDRLLSVVSLRSPVPLEPGARLGFTASGFPGGSSLEDTAELALQVRLESVPDADNVVPVAVQVDVFHTVGSALFVRGTVANSGQVRLENAAVLAEIRRLDGSLFSAGWSELPAPLEPGSPQDFVLELPLAEPLDLTTVELDLRAYGTRASQ